MLNLQNSSSSLSKIGTDAINYGNQVIASARDLGQSVQAATRFKPQIKNNVLSVPITKQTRERQYLDGDNTLHGGEQLILIAIAQYPDGVSREQLTVLSGYKPSSRNTYLQRLSSRGFVSGKDRIIATQEGIEALGPSYHPLPTGQALIEHWSNRLTGGEKIIFDIVVKAYPEEITRDDLDSQSPYKPSSRNTFIQRLQARELVTAGRNTIRASDHLFS